MSKIHKIEIRNLKAVSSAEMTFNGCTVLVTGGNDKGKSTILSSIMDRIKGLKPEHVVKHGETEGEGTLELTTGEKFMWKFDSSGADKLIYTTQEGVKGSVTREISKKYFPTQFDIDKFLISTPKDQSKMLQKLVGLDFTEIDARYKVAFDARTDANREEYRLRQNVEKIFPVPAKLETVSIDDLVKEKNAIRAKLDELYQKNKRHNDGLRAIFDKTKDDIRKAVKEFNQEQDDKQWKIDNATKDLSGLQAMGYNGKEVEKWIETLPKSETRQSVEIEIGKLEEPPFIKPEKPEESELEVVDAKIIQLNETNEKASEWKRYQDQVNEHRDAEEAAKTCDDKVKEIEAEKFRMIQGANIPEGIEFTEEGIVVDGFPLSKTDLSKSSIYCAALRLASIGLGEVKTLHFDASPLDRVKLSEIEAWAEKHDLQLLIERPDFDNGDIQYQILEIKK